MVFCSTPNFRHGFLGYSECLCITSGISGVNFHGMQLRVWPVWLLANDVINVFFLNTLIGRLHGVYSILRSTNNLCASVWTRTFVGGAIGAIVQTRHCCICYEARVDGSLLNSVRIPCHLSWMPKSIAGWWSRCGLIPAWYDWYIMKRVLK